MQNKKQTFKSVSLFQSYYQGDDPGKATTV